MLCKTQSTKTGVLCEFAKWAVVAMFVWSFIPKYYTENVLLPRIDIPFINGLWALAFGFCATQIINVRTIENRLFFAYAVGMVIMIFRGILNSSHPLFTWYYIAQDISTGFGVLGGIMFAQMLCLKAYLKVMLKIYYLAVIIIGITLFGIRSGFISANTIVIRNIGERIYDPAQFASSGFILFLAPCLWFNFPSTNILETKIVRRIFIVVGIFFALLTGYYSGTRSFVLWAIFVVGCMIIVIGRDYIKSGKIIFAAIVVVAVSVISMNELVVAVSKMGVIGDRFMQLEDVKSESRYYELEVLYEQMSTLDLCIGKGFGVGFISPIVGEDLTSDVLWPHIGLFAPWQKGGVFMFVASLIPAIMAIKIFVFERVSDLRQGFLIGVLQFFVLACVSGGWYFTTFFTLGSMLVFGFSDMPFGKNINLKVARILSTFKKTKNCQTSM